MIALRRSQTTRSPSGPLVHTIDHKATYMLDRTKPCGFAISLVTPELRDRIVVHAPQDSSQCREIVGNGELTFAFIDGNHRHPWPLVDFLRLHSLIKSGWVLLHDVDLPDLIARTIAAGHKVDHVPVFGAKHVYDLWPHEKVRAGNIAVLKVASSTDSLGDFVSQMRTLPSEVSAGSWIKRWREIDSLMGTRAL